MGGAAPGQKEGGDEYRAGQASEQNNSVLGQGTFSKQGLWGLSIRKGVSFTSCLSLGKTLVYFWVMFPALHPHPPPPARPRQLDAGEAEKGSCHWNWREKPQASQVLLACPGFGSPWGRAAPTCVGTGEAQGRGTEPVWELPMDIYGVKRNH